MRPVARISGTSSDGVPTRAAKAIPPRSIPVPGLVARAAHVRAEVADQMALEDAFGGAPRAPDPLEAVVVAPGSDRLERKRVGPLEDGAVATRRRAVALQVDDHVRDHVLGAERPVGIAVHRAREAH